MKSFLKDNWFKLLISFPIILFGLSLSYYLVIFIPEQERFRLQQRDAEVLAKQKLLFQQECKNEMGDDFSFFEESDLSPELIQIGLKNKGYADNSGNFIDDDVWIKECIERKVNIWME